MYTPPKQNWNPVRCMLVRVTTRKRFFKYKYKWSCHSNNSTCIYAIPFKTIYCEAQENEKEEDDNRSAQSESNRKGVIRKIVKKRRIIREVTVCARCAVMLGYVASFHLQCNFFFIEFIYIFYLFMCIFRIIAIKISALFFCSISYRFHLIYLNKQFYFSINTLRNFCLLFSTAGNADSVLFLFNCLGKCVDFGHTSAFSSLTFDDTELKL